MDEIISRQAPRPFPQKIWEKGHFKATCRRLRSCKHRLDSSRKVVARHPSIGTNPRLFWNFDETEVPGEFSKHLKVFSSASLKRGRFHATDRDTGSHLTACVTAHAAGDVLLHLFVFAGKIIIAVWTEPLPSYVYKEYIGVPKWYSLPHWHLSAGKVVLCGTPNGSTDAATIPFIINHIINTRCT